MMQETSEWTVAPLVRDSFSMVKAISFFFNCHLVFVFADFLNFPLAFDLMGLWIFRFQIIEQGLHYYHVLAIVASSFVLGVSLEGVFILCVYCCCLRLALLLVALQAPSTGSTMVYLSISSSFFHLADEVQFR